MNQLLNDTNTRMKSICERLASEYAGIQAGRANTSVLNKIEVDYYGTKTPINQLAAVSVAEARVLVIQPWDVSLLSVIEKEIQKSDIGINPQNDGKVIRLIFPQLTQDRRKEIAKEISAMAENSKISVRNARRDTMDKIKNMKKDSKITEDDQKKGEKRIQDLTDRFCEQIDSMCGAKATEVMSI